MKRIKTVYLTDEVAKLLDLKSEESGISRSALVEKALVKYLEK